MGREPRREHLLDNFHLLPLLHFTESGGPEVVEVLLVEALVSLSANRFLELFGFNDRRFDALALLRGGLALELGPALAQFLHSLVGNGLDPASLLPVRLAGGRERNQAADRERVLLEDEVGLASGLELPVAVGVRWARLTLRFNERNSPIGNRNLGGDDLSCWPTEAAVTNFNLLLPVPRAISDEHSHQENCERSGKAEPRAGTGLPAG